MSIIAEEDRRWFEACYAAAGKKPPKTSEIEAPKDTMRVHKNYTIRDKRSLCMIRRSFCDGEQNCLRIEYMSDGPSEEGIVKFIADEYPELKDREINFIYNDPDWLSEYNMGKPKGCFALVFVFFKKVK